MKHKYLLLSILALFLVLASVFLIYKSVNTKNLVKIDEIEYTFYYPDYFISFKDPKFFKAYIGQNKNELGGSNLITISYVSQEPNVQNCKTIVAGLEIANEKTTSAVVDSKVISESKFFGCYIKSKYQIGKYTFISESKIIQKRGKQSNAYAVNIVYLENTVPSEIVDLQNSFSKFQLK